MCVSDKINAFCGEGDCKCARSRDGFTQLQMLVLALEELSSHETGVRRSGEIVIQRASAPLWRTAAVSRASQGGGSAELRKEQQHTRLLHQY